MFFPFYDLILLGFESASVVNKRLVKIGRGGAQSADEIGRMLREKAVVSFESATTLIHGGTGAGLIARLREHVAANEARLSES